MLTPGFVTDATGLDVADARTTPMVFFGLDGTTAGLEFLPSRDEVLAGGAASGVIAGVCADDPEQGWLCIHATTPEEAALISTDQNPYLPAYDKTVAETVTSGKPSFVFFATPAFCQTGFCGPTVELVKSVAREHEGAVEFVNVELYDMPANRFVAEYLGCDESRVLDQNIVRKRWMVRQDIEGRRNDLRTPVVLRCIRDYEAGKRQSDALLTGMLPLQNNVDVVLANADLV